MGETMEDTMERQAAKADQGAAPGMPPRTHADEIPLLVAVDDGYAQIKLVGQDPAGTSKPVTLMRRSSARPGRYGLSSTNGDGGIGCYEVDDGEIFTVSENVEAESTQFDGYHTSTMNRVLVHHALAEAGYRGRRVKLVTGLPVSDFFFDGARDDRKIADKRANLMAGIRDATAKPRPLAILDDVKVGCQAIAAFVDYVLDDDLEERDVVSEKVAVVDIGGRTTDIALIRDGSEFDDKHSGTVNVGVLDVYAALERALRGKFGIRDGFSLAQKDGCVRTGRVKLWNESHDVSDIVSETVREQEVKIAREVERKLGSASNVDVVLFVGGGSALFSGIAKRFRNGVMATDPEFSNARGLFKNTLKFAG